MQEPTHPTPTLHILCGKIAAGKSTLAAELSQAPNTVRLIEDDWLGTLFAGEMTTGADFVRYSARLRTIMGPHVASLLNADVSVVLDFAANTVEQRAWMRSIADNAEATHQLHFLDASDEVCLARLKQRNETGEHPFAVSEAQFHQFTKHFAPPTPDEGFNVVVHEVAG